MRIIEKIFLLIFVVTLSTILIGSVFVLTKFEPIKIIRVKQHYIEPRENKIIAKITPNEKTIASFYSDAFHGKETANGEIFNKGAWTAASKTIPLNSMVLVTNIKNGLQKIVKINDRGPYIEGRNLDLSEKAFEFLSGTEGLDIGLLDVEIQLISIGDNKYRRQKK